MDAAFRFGRVEVSCEGFSHPDDPYILRGSCGLEFTIELTEEGRRTRRGATGGFKGFEGKNRRRRWKERGEGNM